MSYPNKPNIRIQDLPDDARLFMIIRLRECCKQLNLYKKTSEKFGMGIEETEEDMVEAYNRGLIKFFGTNIEGIWLLKRWNGYEYESLYYDK